MSVVERDALLEQGREIRFPDQKPDGMPDADWLQLRTIPATALEALFDPVTRTSTRRVVLHNVIVSGELNCRHVVAAVEFRATKSLFDSPVDFSGTQFQGPVDFSEAQFHGPVRLRSARFDYDLRLDLAFFEKESVFELIDVGGVFSAQGTIFQQARFQASHFSKPAVFSPKQLDSGRVRRTAFCGDGLFVEARFDGTATFSRVHFRKNVDFSRAAIGMNLFFRSELRQGQKKPSRLWCGGTATFLDTTVGGSVDLNGAQFKGLVTFTRLRAGAGLFCRALPEHGERIRARFSKDAWFVGIQVTGRTVFGGASFAGRCDFEGAQLKGDAFFNTIWESDVRFEVHGDANFRGLLVEGTTDFTAAIFKRNARFDRARFVGSLYCGSAIAPRLMRPLFCGLTTFNDMAVQGAIFFSGACFREEVSFRRMQIQSSVYFGAVDLTSRSARTTFRSRSFFTEVRIAGTADFIAAKFRDVTSWDRASVGGSILFRPMRQTIVNFSAESEFRDVEIRGVADFSNARFTRNLNLNRARLGAGIFSGARFNARCSLVDAQIQVIDFGSTSKDRAVFASALSLQGLTYARFSGDWRALVARLPPGQLQPYTQLEKHFRAVAEDGEADKVYVACRRKERAVLKRRVHLLWTDRSARRDKVRERVATTRDWFLNWALDRFFYYGLPCWRHIAVAAVLFIASIFLLLLPGALTPREVGTEVHNRRDRVYASSGAALTNLIPGEHASELAAWEPSKRLKPLPIGLTYFQWAAFLRYTIYALAGLGAAQLAALKKTRPD